MYFVHVDSQSASYVHWLLDRKTKECLLVVDDTSDTLQPKLALSRIESILFNIWLNTKNTGCFIPLMLFRLVIATDISMVNGMPSTFFHRFDIHIDAVHVPGSLTSLATTQIQVWTDIRRYAQ